MEIDGVLEKLEFYNELGVLVCVRVLRIYADHGWNFFHTFCTNTAAKLLPRLIALRRLLTFFFAHFLPFFS